MARALARLADIGRPGKTRQAVEQEESAAVALPPRGSCRAGEHRLGGSRGRRDGLECRNARCRSSRAGSSADCLRALAILHAAMYDAINGIERSGDTYFV